MLIASLDANLDFINTLIAHQFVILITAHSIIVKRGIVILLLLGYSGKLLALFGYFQIVLVIIRQAISYILLRFRHFIHLFHHTVIINQQYLLIELLLLTILNQVQIRNNPIDYLEIEAKLFP